MKKLLFGLLSAATILLTAADPYFGTATKHVDTGGEMLEYRNLTPALEFLSQWLPKASAAVVAEEGEYGPVAGSALKVLFNVLDLRSLKAIASSSVQAAPGVYLFKQFIVVAPDSGSILTYAPRGDRPLDFSRLPADTRIAVCGDLDLGYIWQRVTQEAAATGDAQLKALLAQCGQLKAQGIDLDALMSSISGPMLVLVSGSSMENLGVRLDIPDRNGALTALLRKFIPAPADSSMVPIPLPLPLSGWAPQLVYAEGKVQFVSGVRMLKAPVAPLASEAWFADFSKRLPQSGTGFVVVNMPKEVTDMINAFLATSAGNIPVDLPPFRAVAVGSRDADGVLETVVSDFSLPTAQITAPVVAQGAMLFSTLRGVLNKTDNGESDSDLPEVAAALEKYAAAHNGVWPTALSELKPLVKDSYVLDDKIFIGGGLKVAGLADAEKLPVLFDAPDDEGADVEVEVLFADGHVESVEVKKYTTAEQVISALNKRYNYSPAQLQDMLGRLKAAKK